MAHTCIVVIVSEAKNPLFDAAIKEGFFASLRTTTHKQ
jgi:hypothetical protein